MLGHRRIRWTNIGETLGIASVRKKTKWIRAPLAGQQVTGKQENVSDVLFNPLTAGVVYIRFFTFFISTLHNYHLLNLLKIKSDINLQDLKFVNLHFVKSE